MSRAPSTERGTEEEAVVTAARAGDEGAFTELVERHRGELQVHCYRMLGSLEDSEDQLQETFLRAWRKRESFSSGGPSSFRAWLYRIATNACLDALRAKPRRLLPSQLGPGATPPLPVQPPADLPWLQPYPDHLLEGIAPREEEPDSRVVARETLEIAFMAAIQLLPPKQRAVLIVRDVLGWSAKETASLLEVSVAAANSALQRARGTLREHLPEQRLEWGASSGPSAEERALLGRFIETVERGDVAGLAEMLREDARATMPPTPDWHDGREAIVTAITQSNDPDSPFYVGEFRLVPVGSNLQPAAAGYLRRPGDSQYRAFALDVLRFEQGKLVEITAFGASAEPNEPGEKPFAIAADLFSAFRLPPTL